MKRVTSASGRTFTSTRRTGVTSNKNVEKCTYSANVIENHVISHMDILPKGKGYPQDFREAHVDRDAVEACKVVFGNESTNRVLDKYKRAVPSSKALYLDLLEYDIPRVQTLRDDPIYQLALQTVRDEFIPKEKVDSVNVRSCRETSKISKR